jgi:hypothetical protein
MVREFNVQCSDSPFAVIVDASGESRNVEPRTSNPEPGTLNREP